MSVEHEFSSNVRPTTPTYQKEITFHEHFIYKLAKGTEYTVVVKAYNSAGSGPQSHEIIARTFDGDLPPSFQLAVIDTTEETISFQWYQKVQTANPQAPITGYSIHYRKETEHKWKEMPVSSLANPSPNPNILSSFSFVLENLDANVQYKIYVVAINRFGVGDPSNIVVAQTQNGMYTVHHNTLRGSFTNIICYNREVHSVTRSIS